MSTAPSSNRLDRPEMTRRPIEPAQQTAARVVGFTYLFTLATVVFAQFLLGAFYTRRLASFQNYQRPSAARSNAGEARRVTSRIGRLIRLKALLVNFGTNWAL